MSQVKVLLILASKSALVLLANNTKSKRRYRTGRIENRKERDEIIEESAVMKGIVQF